MGRMQTPLEKGLKLLCPGSTDSQPGLSPLAPGVGAITVPSLARWDNKHNKCASEGRISEQQTRHPEGLNKEIPPSPFSLISPGHC